MAALALTIQPLRELAAAWDRHRVWQVARSKCLQLLATPRLRRGGARVPESFGASPPVLSFERVGLAAEGRRFDARAAAGRRIAAVGPTGAGKSSLLNLAAGLDRPARGRVRIDGVAPTALAPAHQRRLLVHLSPQAPILAGSLRRALTLGISPRPGDESLRAIAQRFGLGATLTSLGGLDGRVAEEGRNLSSGERGRLLLARAALAMPRLLLVDAADTSLDRKGRDALRALVREVDATVLLVTQDPALAREMDEVWFVRDGRVVEAGPPELVLAGNRPAAGIFQPGQAA